MPWGDRTGPLGMGPRTGRGLGYCSGFDSPGFVKGPGWGFGFGRGWRWRGGGRGLGRGWRWKWLWFMGGAPFEEPDPATEKEWLKAEAESLKRRLTEIEKRLGELGKE